MELKDTVKGMMSDDYKERMAAEYHQTKIRYEKLKKLNTRMEAKAICTSSAVEPQLDGTPARLLRDQQRIMGEYRSTKKRLTLSCKAFFGAPSVGALRIQSCGLNLATSPRETNTSACAKCESVPKGMVQQKSRNIRCGFFWCTIGDSNPGPTD